MKQIIVTFRLADNRCHCLTYPLRDSETKATLSRFHLRAAAEKLVPVIAGRYGMPARVERVILRTRDVRELK